MRVYKTDFATPEEKAAKREAYDQKRFEEFKPYLRTNLDGSVNAEFFLYELIVNGAVKITDEGLKQFCQDNNLDYDRIKTYLLFS